AQLDGSGAVRSSDPVQLEEAGREGDSQLPREVGTTLGPVVAGLARARWALDAEVFEEGGAGVGEEEDLGLAFDQAAVDERVGDPDPEPPGEVAVTGARGAEGSGALGLAQ